MVNANRVKRKLPCLLLDEDTGERKSNNAFMRNRYRFSQFQKRNPQRYDSLVNQLCSVLDQIDKEMAVTVTTGEPQQLEKKPVTIFFRPTEQN